MKTCSQCETQYDESVEIPSPLPDGMCAECGTQLTEEQITKLIEKLSSQLKPQE